MMHKYYIKKLSKGLLAAAVSGLSTGWKIGLFGPLPLAPSPPRELERGDFADFAVRVGAEERRFGR